MLLKKIKFLALLLLISFSCSSQKTNIYKKDTDFLVNLFFSGKKDTIHIDRSANIYQIRPDSLWLLDNYKVIIKNKSVDTSYIETIAKGKFSNPKFIVVSDEVFNFQKPYPKSIADYGPYTHKFRIEYIKFRDENNALINVSQICYYKNFGQDCSDDSYELFSNYEKINGEWKLIKYPINKLKP